MAIPPPEAKPVRLRELVEAVTCYPDDQYEVHVGRKSGSVIPLDMMEIDELGRDSEELPEFVDPELAAEARKAIEGSPDYVVLIGKEEIDEYRITEDLIDQLEVESDRLVLRTAIKGKGAFRRFKDALHELELSDRWYSYRDEQIAAIVIEWCKDNEVEFVDDRQAPVQSAVGDSVFKS